MVAAALTVRTVEGDATSHAAAANAAIAGTRIGRDERVRESCCLSDSGDAVGWRGRHNHAYPADSLTDAKSMLMADVMRLAQRLMQYLQRPLVASQAVLLGCAQWINAASR